MSEAYLNLCRLSVDRTYIHKGEIKPYRVGTLSENQITIKFFCNAARKRVKGHGLSFIERSDQPARRFGIDS